MQSRNGFVLRPAALDDLVEIWEYGASVWGMAQADRYADGLFALFELLAAFPEMARERTELDPPVRIYPSEAHLVIYRREGQGIEIIRFLHARQDLASYLLEG
ncbi:MAG TPA: type II toxin-antitoxin system RelE/ParE family toxin [Roseovarius sp.]|nr:type II toxin-antitoxin system RelE/ParE family toxin [Roseovarius sp.]